MSSKKEHHIPIKISRMMRILEGATGPKKSGDKVILPAKEPSAPKAVEPQKTRPFARERMAIEALDEPKEGASTYAIGVSVSQEPPPSEEEHPREARRLSVHTDMAQKDPENLNEILAPVLEEEERVETVVHTHPLKQGEPAAIPLRPTNIEGIEMGRMRVAYFCMEIGIQNAIPLYSGGLGVLAGDMLKSCVDLDVPMIGVSLLYRKGFFRQRFDASGWQMEDEEMVDPAGSMVLLPARANVVLEGRNVVVRPWLYLLKGVSGKTNPIIFLDTDCEENAPEDREITHKLYAGDRRHRLLQEAVLGIGGVRILEALGVSSIEKYHMNEGHASLLTVELYRRFLRSDDPIGMTHRSAVFTTHTPIASGHDMFAMELVEQVLGKTFLPDSLKAKIVDGKDLNMTKLGFELSGHINGVAKKHGDVTREMFPGYKIDSITNGVYAREWISEPMKRLFSKYLPGWEIDPYSLRYALSLPSDELWEAHLEAKRKMLHKVREWTGVEMKEDVFTIGFARRATSYKRAELLFLDIERLKRIAASTGKGIQIIFAGKAHPDDHEGKLIIQRIIGKFKDLGPFVTACYVPGYDMGVASSLVSGVDLWLNTPKRPLEASGTSGMKAALNGVPQFSILDGWWLEGHIENITGWSIGPHPEHAPQPVSDREDSESLYTKLAYVILPKYYEERDAWIRVMRHAVAINGSFFNTHRMVEQYVLSTYFR